MASPILVQKVMELSPLVLNTLEQLEKEQPECSFDVIQIANRLQKFLTPEQIEALRANAPIGFIVGMSLSILISQNKVLFDQTASFVRITQKEGYKYFKELQETIYKGYQLDASLSFQPKEALTLSLEQLAQIHLTPFKEPADPKILQFEEQLALNNCTLMLDQKSEFQPVLLASFPRGGSSFSRKLIEQISGIVTGSIFPSFNFPDFSLLLQGSKGEGITDGRANIFKSHFPIYSKLCKVPLASRKAIVVVRNPIDALVSWFHFNVSVSMNLSLETDILKKFNTEIQQYLQQAIMIYKEFCLFWKQKALSKKFPVNIIRYEDIVSNKQKVFEGVFQFYYNQQIEGTYISERIKRVSQDESSGRVYKPRSSDKKDNLKYYNEEILKLMINELREILIFFGYHKCEENPESIFEYQDLSEEDKELEFGFRKTNAMQSEVQKIDKEEITPIDSQNDAGIDIKNIIPIHKMCTGIREQTEISK